MTAKERIKAALEFQQVDRVPTAVLDGGVWVIEQEGLSFEDLFQMEDGGASLFVKHYDRMESDIAWVGGGCFGLPNRAVGAHAVYGEVGKAAEVGTVVTEPEKFKDLDTSNVREKLLADAGIQAILRQTKAMKESLGDSKYVALIGGAPFSMAGMMVGVQDFMELLFDEEIKMQQLFDFAVELSAEYANLCVEAGANMVCLGDPVASGDLISPAMYREFALPLLRQVLPKIKGAEKIILHICGNTITRLPELVDSGIDGFSLDSVDMTEALKIAKDHYAILGNMSPFDVMKSKTPEEVEAICTELCQTAGLGGGLILMPGCDLSVGTSIENIQAMAKAAKGYRG